eukprot:gnl/Chilomastix_caulleri/3660.p1 GENE.gnl/Chilomastix_caulleri/3660~~gnl/Chilomastix_caulleri/3660.p1  ORF type:complete len:57 (+),score=10.68 gnl/Chilomastix_caulleri/3660:177-347(+)
MSEGRILEGGYVWVLVAMNCLVFYHSMRVILGVKPVFGVLMIVVLMIVGFCRPLFL